MQPPQAPPKEGMSLTLLTYFHRFKLYPICLFALLSKTTLLSPMFICYHVFKTYVIEKYVSLLSMSKTSNISYFNYLFNNYTLCCQTDVVRLIHTTSSDHCSYNGNHLILDIIQCNHRLLSSFYKPLIILCNLWTSPYRG